MSLKDTNPVNPKRRKRVAIVIANPRSRQRPAGRSASGGANWRIPITIFTEKGYEVEVFSPDGGACTADALSDPRDPSGYSSSDLVTMGFIATPKLSALVEATKPVPRPRGARSSTRSSSPGGQSPMFTFRDSPRSCSGSSLNSTKPARSTAALCHGTAILRYARSVERRAARKGQDRHRLRQRRGRLRRQRGLGRWARCRGTARHAVADRRRVEGARRQLHPSRPVATASRSATGT